MSAIIVTRKDLGDSKRIPNVTDGESDFMV